MIRNILILAFLAMAPFTLQAKVNLLLVDPLESVFPDSNKLNGYTNKLTLGFPQGTVADVHIMLNVPAGESFSIEAFFNGRQLPVKYWSILIDVPVEENTGLDAFTELHSKQINPYVIRRAPFLVYDAIRPLKENTIAAKNTFTILRFAIPVSELGNPGSYLIKIVAKGKGWKQEGEFTAQVYNPKIPVLKDGHFFLTFWFNLTQMEKKHQVVRWTESWYTMLDKYAAMMAYGRQNSILIPSELISLVGGKITLDEEKLYKFIEVFRKYGFTYFEAPHFMYRGDNDDWKDPELKVCITKRRYYTPEAKKDVDTIITLIKNFTAKYNLTNYWVQHVSDEPDVPQAKCYRDVVKQVKSIYPEIKIMDASSLMDSIAGAMDIWCPLLNVYQKHEEFYSKREQTGEKILVYTCLCPGGKFLNRLLDQERLRQVYFGWGAAQYNSFGYLHWGLNWYLSDPFTQSVVKNPSPSASPNERFPAGDTHCVYPGEEGPLSSTRFEAHRMGIEDYELLLELKKKNPALADQIIKMIFTNYSEYSVSVKEYRDARKKLLESL